MPNDNNHKIKLFEGHKVRTVWSDKEQQWYFSIVDVCGILTDQLSYDNARNYWKVLKHRLISEGFEPVTNCNQLKLVSPKDGKRRLTDPLTPSTQQRGLTIQNTSKILCH